MKKGVGQSEKLFHWNCKGAGARQNAPCPKNKTKRVLWHIVTKMSGQPSANSRNQPLKTPHFAPFPKVRKITQIVSHWLSVNCKQYFAFLYFCVFVFRILTAKCDTTEKDISSVTQPAVLREDWMRFGIKVNSVWPFSSHLSQSLSPFSTHKSTSERS